uniref:regucalcin-like n=1 Tax=Urocitellus parryii TaxID=9999 RepID=UPI000E55AF35
MGECPVWEEETGQLVYVDITARTVCQWNPLSGEVQTMGLRDPVAVWLCAREGIYVVAFGTCLGLLDWETGQVEWAAWLDHDKPHNMFNNGKVDPTGSFEAAGSAGHPNGLDWSLDHLTLYHMDSLVYSVQAYDYNMQTGGLGMRLCTLEMPVFRVTSCYFQGRGADYPGLCVTSAVDSLSPEQLLLELQAGHVFK